MIDTPRCPRTHAAADAFWRVWRQVGVPHKHGYYESTWLAIDAAMAATEERAPMSDAEWHQFIDKLRQSTYFED